MEVLEHVRSHIHRQHMAMCRQYNPAASRRSSDVPQFIQEPLCERSTPTVWRSCLRCRHLFSCWKVCRRWCHQRLGPPWGPNKSACRGGAPTYLGMAFSTGRPRASSATTQDSAITWQTSTANIYRHTILQNGWSSLKRPYGPRMRNAHRGSSWSFGLDTSILFRGSRPGSTNS